MCYFSLSLIKNEYFIELSLVNISLTVSTGLQSYGGIRITSEQTHITHNIVGCSVHSSLFLVFQNYNKPFVSWGGAMGMWMVGIGYQLNFFHLIFYIKRLNYRLANSLSDGDADPDVYIGLLNASKDRSFIQTCIEIVSSLNLRVTVDLQ